jgi:hypothetical protein
MAAYTTIDDPSAHFKVQLHTGTGSSLGVTYTDTDTDMQPDLVWIKNRDQADNHLLCDSVRGTGVHLYPNANSSQSNDANGFTAFGSNGFTVGTYDLFNTSGEDYVSWSWKAGTTSGITTNGSTDITPSTYSFNQTAGFSITEWTGTATTGDTLAHGIGAAPTLTIRKRKAASSNWMVGHGSLGWTTHVFLDTYDDKASAHVNYFSNTAPDSVNITLGSDVNEVGAVIGWHWAPIQGFSKFGSYEGNGNADGAFIYTGFRPALVMIKNVDGSTMSWTMRGNGLNPFNPADGHVVPNTTAAEATGKDIDILSNGFKARTTDGGVNASGNTHVYAAFAEAPFVNSNGVPCNAR